MKGFTQPAIPDIVGSEVGKPGSHVTVNTAEKKQICIYMPCRAENILSGSSQAYVNVACAKTEDIVAVTIKTDILLNAQKVGYNNEVTP